MTSTIRSLKEKYSPLGMLRGGAGALLLPHGAAVSFIKECRDNGIVILGMDFFKDTDRGLIAMINAKNYSSLPASSDLVEETTSRALADIKFGFPDNCDWVEFVLDNRE
jgi:hypothetical protein